MTSSTLADLDLQIAEATARLAALQSARANLAHTLRCAELDAQIAALPAAIQTALREPWPRAKDFKDLVRYGLAYTNGGASRHWTREKGEPLHQRITGEMR